MKLIWIHQNIKREWTDGECLEFATTQRNKQLAADLAVYRKRLLDEAEWLEKWHTGYQMTPYKVDSLQHLEDHIASLRKEAEGEEVERRCQF